MGLVRNVLTCAAESTRSQGRDRLETADDLGLSLAPVLAPNR